MPDIRQRVANMLHNQLDADAWGLVVATCDVANTQGHRLIQMFSPTAPVGDEHVFVGFAQRAIIANQLRAAGFPAPLAGQVQEQPVPPGHITVLCSVVGGIAVVHVRYDDQVLPPPEQEKIFAAMPAEGQRRLVLLQETLETITLTYARMVGEGLDPGAFSVLVVDPNLNAMGLKLIAEVEADENFVTRMKADADRGVATPYVNFAENAHLGPFMADLKIETDGRVVDSAITRPVQEDHLRVVVCTRNGASTFDIARPIKVAGPGIPEA